MFAVVHCCQLLAPESIESLVTQRFLQSTEAFTAGFTELGNFQLLVLERSM